MDADDDTMLKCLIDLAENTPRYLRHQFAEVITLSMKVCVMFVISLGCLLVLIVAQRKLDHASNLVA